MSMAVNKLWAKTKKGEWYFNFPDQSYLQIKEMKD